MHEEGIVMTRDRRPTRVTARLRSVDADAAVERATDARRLPRIRPSDFALAIDLIEVISGSTTNDLCVGTRDIAAMFHATTPEAVSRSQREHVAASLRRIRDAGVLNIVTTRGSKARVLLRLSAPTNPDNSRDR